MSDPEKLRAEVKKLVKADIIIPAKDERKVHTRIPTGIHDLDLKLGGGFPTGCVNVVYGPASSAKSLVALLTIKNVQRTCRKCYTPFSEKAKCVCKKNDPCRTLYVDAERYWEDKWVKKVGVSTDNVYIGKPRHLEEAFDIMDISVREDTFDAIMLDSVAALSPKAEKEATMEEWQTGLVPRVYTKFLRKWASELGDLSLAGRRLPMVLIVNQIRQKVGVMYGNPEIMPGGDAQVFYATTIVRLSRRSLEVSKDKKDPQPLWQQVHYKIEKSKASPTRREGEFDLAINHYIDEDGNERHAGEILDNYSGLIEYARRFNLMEEKQGAGYKFEGRSFKTLEELRTALRDDVALRWSLFQATNTAYDQYVPSATSVGGDRKEKASGEESKAKEGATASS